MVYGDLQFVDILIFAGVAIFLIYRLRSVLGKRTGYQKNTTATNQSPKPTENEKKEIPSLKDNEIKLSLAYENLDNFDHKSFLDGAKNAFEIIITAFNQGDKKTLKPLVSKNVYNAFEKAIDEKTNDPTYQFYSLVIEGVENTEIIDGVIKITLRFVSEQFKNEDESSIIKKHDIWTFEKSVNSSSPLWLLSST
tara:strand:+ start:9698 stop:10279 length:582 start_codon:yes stop_codon:yes gene_type:complete